MDEPLACACLLESDGSTAPAEKPRQQRFFRSGIDDTAEFDATDEGFTPNFAKSKDDLDVPAFLRKQMD